jgi:hypothetical protein
MTDEMTTAWQRPKDGATMAQMGRRGAAGRGAVRTMAAYSSTWRPCDADGQEGTPAPRTQTPIAKATSGHMRSASPSSRRR